jgi:hypothetical protein
VPLVALRLRGLGEMEKFAQRDSFMGSAPAPAGVCRA